MFKRKHVFASQLHYIIDDGEMCRFRNPVDDTETKYETLKPSVLAQLPHLQQPFVHQPENVKSLGLNGALR